MLSVMDRIFYTWEHMYSKLRKRHPNQERTVVREERLPEKNGERSRCFRHLLILDCLQKIRLIRMDFSALIPTVMELSDLLIRRSIICVNVL